MNAIFKEGFSFSGFERDLLALSLGSKRFLDISGVSGVDSISDGRGSLFADLDNDGDLDIFLTAVQREAHFLFRNNVGGENGFLRIELEGTRSGRDAFGAVVRVKSSAGIQTKIKAGGSGFLSQSDPRLLFGLGQDRYAEWVEVTWPGGAVQRFGRIDSGASLKVIEGQGDYITVAERRFRLSDPLSKSEAHMARLGLGRGDVFPDVTLRSVEDADGEELPLSDLLRPGRRHLINFWATYCLPCAEEMPKLQEFYPRFHDAGIELIGVIIDVESIDRVPAFLRDKGIRYPVYTIEVESISRVFSRGEVFLPPSVLLDERGRVLEVFGGWSDESRQAIRGLIR